MIAYLKGQPAEVTEYDEQLARRIIEKITVYDENFVVGFKAELDVEIEI